MSLEKAVENMILCAGVKPTDRVLVVADDSIVLAAEGLYRRAATIAVKSALFNLDRFGPRPLAWAGRNRLVDMDLPSYERLSEYRLPHFFADRLYDLKIAAARAVVDAGDPAALLPLTLEPALDELLQGVRMGHAFDWRPLTEMEEALAKASRDEVFERALSAGRITRAEGDGTR